VAVLIAPAEASRRARAALEYARFDRDEVQRRAQGRHPQITPATFNRIVSPTNPRGFSSSDELRAFAEACEVPSWFLERGFDEPQRDRLSQVEATLAVLAKAVSLDGLDADEAQVLRSWQQRNEQLSEGTSPESQTRAED
jgi:hypothetical protein